MACAVPSSRRSSPRRDDPRSWGRGEPPAAVVAPARTVDGFTAAVVRVLEVARGGGRFAFATARPAALLQLYRRLAVRAAAAGGEVLAGQETVGLGPTGRRVRWIDQVAVLTDG